MSTTTTSWTRRPSLNTARVIAFGLAVLCALAGWLLMLFYEQFALWLLLTLLAIWVGLKAGPWFVKVLEKSGLFGRVRLDRDHLSAGRGAGALDLARPFKVTVRLHQKVVEHEFRLRHAGVSSAHSTTRTEKKAVSLLQATLEQDDTRWSVIADDTRAPPLPSYDVTGLSCRKAPVARPQGRVIRMHVEDLIALLHQVRDAQGYAAVTAPDTDEISGDPRRLFWAGWKALAGVGVLLGLGIWAAATAMEHAPSHGSSYEPKPLTPEQREERAKASAASRGQRWVGERVAFRGYDGKGNRAYGVVRSVNVHKVPDKPGEYDFTLSVEVSELFDVMFQPAPEGTRIRLETVDDDLALGVVVDVETEHVYKDPKKKKAEAPPGK